MAQHFTGRILALDLATHTGWAHGRPGEKPKWGVETFQGERAKAYRALRAWLNQWIVDKRVDLVTFESSATQFMHGRTRIETIKRLIGLCEHVEELCYGRVECREARVAEVRAHFIGQNIARAEAKVETIRQCKELGWDTSNDNEADALALWSLQVCCLRPDIAIRHTPMFARKRMASF